MKNTIGKLISHGESPESLGETELFYNKTLDRLQHRLIEENTEVSQPSTGIYATSLFKSWDIKQYFNQKKYPNVFKHIQKIIFSIGQFLHCHKMKVICMYLNKNNSEWSTMEEPFNL